jgi:hypothetical protein
VPDAALVRRVRRRLLAWSGGTTLAALFVLGSMLYATVAWSLATTGEQQLRDRARDIATGLAVRGTQIGPGLGEFSTQVTGGPAIPGTTGSWSFASVPGSSSRPRPARSRSS